jgi:hypothetical protein
MRRSLTRIVFTLCFVSQACPAFSCIPARSGQLTSGFGPARQFAFADANAPQPKKRRVERNSIMQISFVKSGGFAGPMTRVQGTVNLKDNQPEVTGDAAYQRRLAPDETAMLRAGAEPALLSQAVAGIASAQARGKGAADLEHYTVNVKTADGKSHEVTFNTSGNSTEMVGVPPATAKLFSWIQEEAQQILKNKLK